MPSLMAATIAATGRAICSAFGVPTGPDDGWDQLAAEMAEDVDLALAAAVVMADASQLIEDS